MLTCCQASSSQSQSRQTSRTFSSVLPVTSSTAIGSNGATGSRVLYTDQALYRLTVAHALSSESSAAPSSALSPGLAVGTTMTTAGASPAPRASSMAQNAAQQVTASAASTSSSLSSSTPRILASVAVTSVGRQISSGSPSAVRATAALSIQQSPAVGVLQTQPPSSQPQRGAIQQQQVGGGVAGPAQAGLGSLVWTCVAMPLLISGVVDAGVLGRNSSSRLQTLSLLVTSALLLTGLQTLLLAAHQGSTHKQGHAMSAEVAVKQWSLLGAMLLSVAYLATFGKTCMFSKAGLGDNILSWGREGMTKAVEGASSQTRGVYEGFVGQLGAVGCQLTRRLGLSQRRRQSLEVAARPLWGFGTESVWR